MHQQVTFVGEVGRSSASGVTRPATAPPPGGSSLEAPRQARWMAVKPLIVIISLYYTTYKIYAYNLQKKKHGHVCLFDFVCISIISWL